MWNQSRIRLICTTRRPTTKCKCFYSCSIMPYNPSWKSFIVLHLVVHMKRDSCVNVWGRGSFRHSTIQHALQLKHTDAWGLNKSLCVCIGSDCAAITLQKTTSANLFSNWFILEMQTNAPGTCWKHRKNVGNVAQWSYVKMQLVMGHCWPAAGDGLISGFGKWRKFGQQACDSEKKQLMALTHSPSIHRIHTRNYGS